MALAAGTEDTAYTITAATLLAGVTDVDGPALSITASLRGEQQQQHHQQRQRDLDLHTRFEPQRPVSPSPPPTLAQRKFDGEPDAGRGR